MFVWIVTKSTEDHTMDTTTLNCRHGSSK